ncbi:helix-turn-helix domain-containing protein [Plantactinospora sp. WMMB334]|uniref:helix-turn-helix domain-containing protein n=1 Tax=Plantactinospora sp. WMMB334 TaxID=3404119 RepID=UPI003B944D74
MTSSGRPGPGADVSVTGELPARLMRASDALGWRMVRALAYADPVETGPFAHGSESLLVVLVASGRYRIESRRGAAWRGASYRPGSVGVTAPGNASVLRWHSATAEPMESLHLHLDPAAAGAVAFPDALSLHDPYVTAAARTLGQALTSAAPALYADSLALALAAHLAHRAGQPLRRPAGRPAVPLGDAEVRRVADHMRANLGENLTVDDLARVARISKFHFIRAFALATGLTPHRYLRRMRLETAVELLRNTPESVARIALRCGYRSPGQFARAFRAEYGVPPAQLRR